MKSIKTIAIAIKNEKPYPFSLLGHGENAGKWYQNGYVTDKTDLDNGRHGAVHYFHYQEDADKFIEIHKRILAKYKKVVSTYGKDPLTEGYVLSAKEELDAVLEGGINGWMAVLATRAYAS